MKLHAMLIARLCLVIVLSGYGFSVQAGLLDDLKGATDTLKSITQQVENQVQQKQNTSQPTQSSSSNSKCGALGAGCINMDDYVDCYAPLKGMRSQVFAQVIDERLKKGGVTAQQKVNLEVDRQAFLTAAQNKTDTVDDSINNRLFEDMPHDDQIEANRRYGVARNEVMSRCAGQDVMGVGHKTQMNYLK